MNLPGIKDIELERVTQPLEQAHTLPRAAYVSEDIYTLELEQVMYKNWIPVARLEQVPEPGCYLTLDFFGQPIMVVHGTDGEVRVMSSVCLHRAAPIASGCGKRHLFTCPYHAWSYDTQGQLIRAPLMDGAADFCEKDHQLPQIRSEIWEGFVLINLDPQAPALQPQIKGLTEYFKNFRLADMRIVKTLEYDSGWNWKVLVENFMEAYHHIAIHKQTFEPTYHARDSQIPDNSGPWSILHMPGMERTGEDPTNTGGFPAIEGLTDWQTKDLFAAVIFPHFLFATHAHGAAWYQVSPVSAERLHLKIHVMVPQAYLTQDDFDADAAGELAALVHDEDIFANDTVWSGLTAPLTQQGRLSPLEKSIWQCNQWWTRQMTAGA